MHSIAMQLQSTIFTRSQGLKDNQQQSKMITNIRMTTPISIISERSKFQTNIIVEVIASAQI
jgi:hypothetical protein